MMLLVLMYHYCCCYCTLLLMLTAECPNEHDKSIHNHGDLHKLYNTLLKYFVTVYNVLAVVACQRLVRHQKKKVYPPRPDHQRYPTATQSLGMHANAACTYSFLSAYFWQSQPYCRRHRVRSHVLPHAHKLAEILVNRVEQLRASCLVCADI